MVISRLNKNGLTLVELILVTVLMGVLVASIGAIYVFNLDILDDVFEQSFLHGEMGHAMAYLSKNLRQAKSIDAFNESSIIFTADLGDGDKTYRLYLYNPLDPESNPPYTENTYLLKWAKENTAYGEGITLVRNIAQPTQTPFSLNADLITVDLTETKNDRSLRLRTMIRPRNL